MEERTIKINLDTAKEWYKEGGFKREIALKAFTEEELKKESWQNIVTFEDACKAIGLSQNTIISRINGLKAYYNNKNLIAQYKLNIIRRALNDDWTPQLNEGKIYYSWLRWYPQDNEYSEEWEKVGIFRDLINHKDYTLVGGGDCIDYDGGLGNFGCGYGDAFATQGLLCCKSKEIAIHLVKYFGKIVLDAMYGQYYNYKWID